MKKIITKKGDIKMLASCYGVSRNSVMNALKYKWNSELCENIREAAKRLGGVEIEIN